MNQEMQVAKKQEKSSNQGYHRTIGGNTIQDLMEQLALTGKSPNINVNQINIVNQNVNSDNVRCEIVTKNSGPINSTLR